MSVPRQRNIGHRKLSNFLLSEPGECNVSCRDERLAAMYPLRKWFSSRADHERIEIQPRIFGAGESVSLYRGPPLNAFPAIGWLSNGAPTVEVAEIRHAGRRTLAKKHDYFI